MPEQPAAKPVTYVVDDDRTIRTLVSQMLSSEDLGPHPFGSAADFLESLPMLKPGVILLDLRMPEMDGFAFMEELARRDVDWPVIMLTGAGDIAVAVQAMKLGAAEFLEKPVRLDALLDAVDSARAKLGERLAAGERRRQARDRIGALTGREQEVLRGLMAGQSNKELAHSLGIGLRTVEMHRGNMMDRLGATSVAQAVALAIEAGVQPADG